MFLPDRQVLTVAVASIYALNLVYMRAIPESPIWALTTDRMKLARKSIATLSSQLSVDGQSQVDVYIRRLSISSQRRSSLASECDLEQVKEPDWRTKVANSNLGRLFKGRLIRKFTLLTVAMHTCVSIADYGSKYFAAKLPGNIYYNNVFTGLSEFIGSMVTFPLIRRFGLKNTSLGLNLAAGCLMLLTMGLLKSPNTMMGGVYMSFAAKTLNIGGWSTQITYMAQLFPSDVRSSGMALVMICSSTSLFLAPLIIGTTLDWLPMCTFGVLSLLSGLLQWFLPNLTNVPMFLNVEDQQRYYSKVSRSKT